MRAAPALGWGRYVRLVLASLLAFAVVIAPLASYVVRKPDYFFARTGETWDPTTQGRETFSVRDNFQRVLFMLHFRGDPQPRHNIPGRPLLDPITGVCFLIGVFVLLKTIGRDPPLNAGILLFWLFPLMPSVFSDAAPHAMRALGAAPAVCLIAAVGLNAIMEGAGRSHAFTVVKGPSVLLAVALGAAAALNYHAFFIEWGRNEAVAADFSGDIPRFFDYAADLAEGNEVYACPYVYFSPNLRFLRIARQVSWKAVEDESAFVAAANQDRDRVYICDAPRVNFLIDKLYPQAEVIGRYSVYTARTGKIYRVKKETLRPVLSDDERAEVGYFMAKVLADFRVQMKQW
jgi:hypothetical protein